MWSAGLFKDEAFINSYSRRQMIVETSKCLCLYVGLCRVCVCMSQTAVTGQKISEYLTLPPEILFFTVRAFR